MFGMSKISENILNLIVSIKKFLIIFVVLGVVVSAYIYATVNYVVVRFNELGPLTKNMSAYYNGFKIGRIVSIEPDSDFKHTLVKVVLLRKNINLPQNTTVYVERFPNGELYLQFVYPQSPSLRVLKSGDILEGFAQSSIEQFMMGQSVSGMSDIVSIHIIKALNSADAANQEMRVFFQVTSKLINDNNSEFNASVKNTARMTKSLAQMAENLNQTSKKLNSALDTSVLKDTTNNIKDMTANSKDAAANIKATTENISKATKDMDKTMKKIDETISQVNSTAQNLNSITSGLNETMSKRFAGVRVMFGTPVKPNRCQKNACK